MKLNKKGNSNLILAMAIILVPIAMFLMFKLVNVTFSLITEPLGLEIPTKDESPKEERYEIIALTDDSDSKKKTFIGIGVESSEDVYKFMVKKKDGQIIREQIRVDDVSVYYAKEDEKPYAVEKTTFEELPLLGTFKVIKYELHIPENSITSGIEIDLMSEKE